MDYFQAIVLGIVQGLTEFLPVSSSGHLVLFQKFLGIDQHSIIFDVAVHIGTLLSVMTVYRKVLYQIFRRGMASISTRKIVGESHLILAVIIATVPTAIIGLSLKDLFESLFSNLMAVGICLIITGLILLFTKGKSPSKQNESLFSFDPSDLKKISFQSAFLLGIAQAAAIAPGISRSGTTIAAAIILGLPRNIAALFSFMLAIPAILGAGILQIKDIQSFSVAQIQVMGAGLLISYLSGLLGLYAVLHLVKNGRLELFTAYLWILGVAVIWFSW